MGRKDTEERKKQERWGLGRRRHNAGDALPFIMACE